MANNIPAVYGLNQYLWAQLQAKSILASADYSGLVPIIPLGEAPQFLQMIDEEPGISTKPYIVYTWYTNGYDCNSWYKPTDTAVYTIYAPNVAKVNEIVLEMTDLFKRYDLSADSVNTYIQASSLSAGYKAYNYGYIGVASATGGVAPTIENDPISATVVLRVNYMNTNTDIPLP